MTTHDTTPRATDADSGGGRRGPHPAIWHTWLTTAWVGAGGVLADAAIHPGVVGHIGLTAGGALLGTLVGGAAMPPGPAEERRLVLESAALGTATGAAAGVWMWAADAANLYADLWQPGLWAALGIGGVAWGAVYTALRARVHRARDPKSATAAKLRKVELGGDYEQILHDAGFGRVEVLEVTPGFGGASERVLIELDPERNDTADTVLSANAKLMGITRRVLRERRGVRIPSDAVTISAVQGDAGRVILDVTLRDMLTETFSPADGEDITTPVLDPSHPLVIGFYQHGGLIEQPEAGPHGIAVGASGSGKSTYFRAQIVQYTRRPHVALAVAGTSKFCGFLRPFLTPVADGRCTRSPFAMIGGGDSGTPEEVDSAVKVLAAAYMLYRHRMASPRIPRDDGGNVVPTPEHPRLVVYLDEVDALIKTKKDGNQHLAVQLPNGEKVTVPHMLTTLGSKGRSEGVELEVGTQRTTDTHLGFASNDLITNINRRAVFRTLSRLDAGAVGGDNLDPRRIPEQTFRLALGAKSELVPAKVFFYSSDDITRGMQAAQANGTLGDLSGEEAAALGDLWSGRWNAARFGSIARYFGFPMDGESPTTPVGGESPRPPRAGGVERVGARSVKLQEAIERARREAGAEAEQSSDLDGAAVDSVIAGMEALLAESAGGAGLARDAAPADVLARVLDIIGDRVGAEPGEILAMLGWVSADTDKAAYDRAAADLRNALRAATGNPDLTTKSKRVEAGQAPRRIFVRDELTGEGRE